MRNSLKRILINHHGPQFFKTISQYLNLNSLSGDKLTCLDIAVLMRYTQMVRLLQAHGAKEGSACK